MNLEDAVAAVRLRAARWEQRGDGDAVVGPGVLAPAGRLWRDYRSPDGTTLGVVETLARLHWARTQVQSELGQFEYDDYWGALVMYALVGNVDPDLLPDEVRSLLTSGPLDYAPSFIGPQHWGRKAAQLLKEVQAEEDLNRLDQAIELLSGCVDAYTPDERYWPGDMANLGLALGMRYFRRGDPADLDRAEQTARAAVRASTPSDPGLPSRLDVLCGVLTYRATRTGDILAWSEAVRLGARAVRTAPQDSELRTLFEENLATARIGRFQLTGDDEELDLAIQELTGLVARTPENHRALAGRRAHLGDAYHQLHLRSHDPRLLDEAVELLTKAVNRTPRTSANRAGRLATLSEVLLSRFEETGDVQDLDDALLTAQNAVEGSPGAEGGAAGAARRAAHHHVLGRALSAAAEHTHEGSFLDRAVEAFREAVRIHRAETGTPDSARAAAVHASLSDALMARRFGSLGRATPFGSSTDRAYEEAQLHWDRMKESGELAGLLDATLLAEVMEAHEARVRSVALVGPHSPHLGSHLCGLSSTSYSLSRLHDRQDLADQALELAERAVRVTPPHHPDRSRAVLLLATLLAEPGREWGVAGRGGETGVAEPGGTAGLAEPGRDTDPAAPGRDTDPAAPGRETDTDTERALALWQELVSDPAVRPSSRASAAAEAARALCRRGEWAAATEQFALALDILPSLVTPAQEPGAQEELLRRWSGLGAEAASCALSAGNPDRAVELLEQGRGILWSQLLDTSTESTALEAVDAELAGRLVTVERELNAPPDTKAPERWWDRIADRRLTLAADREELVRRVRTLPGLADFRRPAGIGELRGAARGGPVVLIVSSQWRTDALIVTTEATLPVPLPVDHGELQKRIRSYLQALLQYESGPRSNAAKTVLNLHVTRALEWLWRDVAEPTLRALGTRAEPAPRPLAPGAPGETTPLPRLWWCPTGLLSLLPLHAAGLREASGPLPGGGPAGQGAGDCVQDRVTSSYTPTLRALLPSRTGTGTRTDTGTGTRSDTRTGTRTDPGTGTRTAADRMLVVGVPTPPGGHADLSPQVAAELAVLRAAFPGPAATVLDGGAATREAVRNELRTHRWAHLSCHGGQDLARPSQGHVMLHDAPLTVADLKADRYAHGEFVFLSACQTALGGVGVPDEVIALTSALQYAGWRQVVGTLWSVGATTAAEVTADLYDTLVRDGALDTEGAAEALHKAVRKLRTAGHPPSLWAPFVHVGS